MGIRAKNNKTIFICQISGSVLKIVKCVSGSSRMKILGSAVEELSSERDDKELSEKVSRVFKRLGYRHHSVIVSLPRVQATCRQLRLPSQSAQEIENIVRLQTGTYLPYPAEELVTAYQILYTDKEGYSHLNLVIAQKDIISRYYKLFGSFKPAALRVVLSSFGLSWLYAHLDPGNAASVTLIDIDSGYAELAITENKKLLFSRCFSLDTAKKHWQDSFIDEFNKSRDAFRKEILEEMHGRVVVLGEGRICEEAAEALKKKVGLPAETLAYNQKLLSKHAVDKSLDAQYSFAALAGLGAGEIEETLYLLPREIKEKNHRLTRRRERLQIILLVAAIIVVWILAFNKNLDNKVAYLKLLQIEVSKLEKQALPLEEMDRKIRLLESHSAKETLSLGLLPELYKVMPGQIYLTNLTCEEENAVTLRGQAPELNSVLTFVSQLEKSALLRGFSVKIKYATRRETAAGKIIDFELNCIKL